MRLTIYIMLFVLALVGVSYYGKPIEAYLDRVKSENNMQQRQQAIVNTDKRASVLQKALVDLDTAIPSADQVRIGVIHNNISYEGNDILQFDIVNSVAPPGKSAGSLSTNLSLNNWSDFLRALLSHQCDIIVTADMVNDAEKARMINAKVAQFVACPILNSKGQLLGAVFADWSKLEDVPVNLDATETALKKTAQTVATTIGNTP